MRNEKNMKLEVDELEKMSAVKALWECSKDYLDDVAITYSADLNVENLNKKPLTTLITYRKLFDNIFKTYDRLKEAGVKKGDIITYSSITTPELIYTIYACNMLGAIIDPIDPRSKEDDLLHHFESEPSKLYFAPEKMLSSTLNVYQDLKVDKIITTSFMESLPLPIRIGASLMNKEKKSVLDEKKFSTLKKFQANAKLRRDLKMDGTKEDIASLTHTTGSTGIPKAIVHNNENWNAQLYNISNSGLDFRRHDTLFNVTVPWVDFGIINVIHNFLCNGIRMDLDPTWTPEKNVEYYLKKNPNWWLGAPGWIDPLFTNPKFENAQINNAKYIITGGAPLFAHKQRLYVEKLKEQFHSDCKVIQGYGLSEITAAAFLDLNNDAGYLGRPMPNIIMDIKDPETLKSVPVGASGELWLAAKHQELSPVAVGYLNKPEETQKTFVTDDAGIRWVRTGDKVHKDETNLTMWESRYKNILTFNGYNINCDKMLDEVEKVPGVAKGAIIGAITSDGNQMPIVCIELNAEANKDFIKEDIYKMIEEKFFDYYKPLDIVIYDELPTKTMKIDYNQIKKDLLNEVGEYQKAKSLTKTKEN